MDRDKDNKVGKPVGSTSAQDSESAAPAIGPHNPALGEIYQRLYPEIRRPKPNQEAIAAALQAMQRLTMEADFEHVTEHESLEPTNDPQTTCRVCGHHNRSGNKFCGSCGILLGTEPSEPAKLMLVAVLAKYFSEHEHVIDRFGTMLTSFFRSPSG